MDDSKQPQLIAVAAVMMTMSATAVALRCWSVWIQPKQKFGWDDFFAVATIPLFFVECGLGAWWLKFGLGRHAAAVPESRYFHWPKALYALSFFHMSAISMPKFSALFFYHRVFNRTTRWFYITIWVIGIANALWLVLGLTVNTFRCWPVRAAYNSSVHGTCFMSEGVNFFAFAVPSMIIDLAILVVPLPLLWKLQTTLKKRLTVIGIFGCGYCVLVITIGVVASLARAGPGLERDATWSMVNFVNWAQCEAAVSVTSVSLPRVLQLVKMARKNGFRSILYKNYSKVLTSTSSQTLSSGLNRTSSGLDKALPTLPPPNAFIESSRLSETRAYYCPSPKLETVVTTSQTPPEPRSPKEIYVQKEFEVAWI